MTKVRTSCLVMERELRNISNIRWKFVCHGRLANEAFQCSAFVRVVKAATLGRCAEFSVFSCQAGKLSNLARENAKICTKPKCGSFDYSYKCIELKCLTCKSPRARILAFSLAKYESLPAWQLRVAVTNRAMRLQMFRG